MNRSKKKHILVGDIGNTESKIFLEITNRKKNYYKKQRNDL